MPNYAVVVEFPSGDAERGLRIVDEMLEEVARGGKKTQDAIKAAAEQYRSFGTGSGNVEAKLLETTAIAAKFHAEAAAGGAAATKSWAQARTSLGEVRTAIESVRASGGPVPAEWIKAAEDLEAAIERDGQAYGRAKAELEGVKRELQDNTRAAGGLGGGITSLSDIVGVFNNKAEKSALILGVWFGAVTVAKSAAKDAGSTINDLMQEFGASEEELKAFDGWWKKYVVDNFASTPVLLTRAALRLTAFWKELATGPENPFANVESGASSLDRIGVATVALQAQVRELKEEEAQLIAEWQAHARQGTLTADVTHALGERAAQLAEELKDSGGQVESQTKFLAASAAAAKLAAGEYEDTATAAKRLAADIETAIEKSIMHARRLLIEIDKLDALKTSIKPFSQINPVNLPTGTGSASPDFSNLSDGASKALGIYNEMQTSLLEQYRILEGVNELQQLGYFTQEEAAALLKAMNLDVFKFEDGTSQIASNLLTAANYADLLASSLGDTRWGRAVSAGASLLRSFQLVKDSSRDIKANLQDFTTGMVGAIQSMTGILEEMGLWKAPGGKSTFGGRQEGSYAEEGSQIGAVIGGIIGAYFGGAAGAQAGMAIGSAAGGMMGGMIKKGAEEALAKLEFNNGDFDVAVSKAEGALGKPIRDMGRKLAVTLTDILDAIGGELTAMADVGFKIRDDYVSVTIGAVRAKFKSIDEAISFAVAEILKQSEISGMTDNMRAALANTQAGDLEELARDLDLAGFIDDLGLPQVALKINGIIDDYRATFRRAEQLGLDTSKLGDWLGQQLQDLRDQILGVTITPQERLQRDKDAYNQQIALIEAEQKMKVADLTFKKADLDAQVAILKAKMQIDEAHFEVRRKFVEGEAALVNAEAQLLGGLLQSLAAVSSALLVAQDILAGLKPISEEEFQEALNRLGRRGGGGGGGKKQDQESVRDWLDERAAAFLPELSRAMRDLNKEYERQIELAHGDKKLLEDLAEQKKKDRWRIFGEGLTRFDDQGSPQAREDEIREHFDAMLKEFPRQAQKIREAMQRAMEGLGLDILAAISPTAALRAEYRALSESIAFLRENAAELGLTAEEVGEAIEEAVNSRLLTLGDSLFGFLERYYGEVEGFEDTRRMLEQVRFELELANLRVQFELLRATGQLSEEVAERIAGVFGFIDQNPIDWSKFDLGRSGGGGFGDSVDRFSDATKTFADAQKTVQQNSQSIREFLDGLALDRNLTTLTPIQQIDEAKRQYAAALGGAKMNDTESVNRALGAAKTFLELMRSGYASGKPYTDSYDQVRADLQGLLGQSYTMGSNVMGSGRFMGRGATPWNPIPGAPGSELPFLATPYAPPGGPPRSVNGSDPINRIAAPLDQIKDGTDLVVSTLEENGEIAIAAAKAADDRWSAQESGMAALAARLDRIDSNTRSREFRRTA